MLKSRSSRMYLMASSSFSLLLRADCRADVLDSPRLAGCSSRGRRVDAQPAACRVLNNTQSCRCSHGDEALFHTNLKLWTQALWEPLPL
ncbi:hypothetical protein EDB81DRAFT_806240 [Dactylonectria macrodidyma]|uniref:Uncharacterized protein n=1 Tax=Dactylonectria macrodidyma TaxID=307937 RepID=A0A9P9IVZ2_9HYPO|nr:hypothetical protein EDB81DRAFT_806240 [Dactylonectria macrodidyma]